jgi:hypothetical protein
MTDQAPVKRSSKSQRTYVRRLKQAARKAGLPYYRPAELPAAKLKAKEQEKAD